MWQLPVVLFIPNLLCYARILSAFVGLYTSTAYPQTSVVIWMFSAILDLFDGMLARKLHQTSQLGIFLDIAADNILRTVVWVGAILSSQGDSIVTLTGCAILSLEWFTMVCTQLHAAQYAKHWKSDRDSDPWLIRKVFENGFKSPLGLWTIYGLFAVPMWVYGAYQPALYDSIPLYRWWMGLAIIGRVLGMTIEIWLCKGFLQVVIDRDEQVIRARRQQQQQQKSARK